MIVLSDNDIILKLAAFNSLEAAIEVCQSPTQEVLVLESALHSFRKSKRLRQRYGDETVERSLAFVEQAKHLTERTAFDIEAEMLSSIEMIDEGEQVLFASTRNFEEFILLTGDKRALRALAAAKKARPVYERLRGRVACLEEITRVLILRQGFEVMREKIAPAAQCDEALRAAFGSGSQAERANVLGVLQSYLDYLENGSESESGVGPNWLKRFPDS